MSHDRLDAMIRNAFPATQVPPDSVERVMAGVFARLDQPAPRSPSLGRRVLALLGELTPSLPSLARQAALPASVALVLGLYAGQFLQPPQHTGLLASLATPAHLLMAGY